MSDQMGPWGGSEAEEAPASGWQDREGQASGAQGQYSQQVAPQYPQQAYPQHQRQPAAEQYQQPYPQAAAQQYQQPAAQPYQQQAQPYQQQPAPQYPQQPAPQYQQQTPYPQYSQQPAAQQYQQPAQPYPQPVQGAYPQTMPVAAAAGSPRHENVGLGLLGAFLGSLAGAVLIIVLSRLGFVAALSGLVMSFVALKGYEKFAGGISTLGIVLTCVIIVAMVFVADWVDWAIVAMRDLDVSFLEAISTLPELFERGNIDSSDYSANLGMLYIFTALGAVPVIIDSFKSRRA